MDEDVGTVETVLAADAPVRPDFSPDASNDQVLVEKSGRNVGGEWRRLDVTHEEEDDPLGLLGLKNRDAAPADLVAVGRS